LKYNAFISYSHSADAHLAPAIERGLEKFAKPAFKRRALRVFRDSNDLSISPDLWGKIEEGLSQSEFLVYCASARSAQSFYCNKEVEYWLAHKSIDNFLLVVTDGELAWDFENNDFDWEKTTAVPKLLSKAFKNEPLYVDFREDIPSENMNLDNVDFKSKLVYIAATLHKKPVGDMIGEGIKQHKRTLRIRNTALTVVFSLMALALVLMYSSIQRRIASELHFQAQALEVEDPSAALRVEAAALEKYDFSEFRNSALSIIANNNFYKILEKHDSTFVSDFVVSARDSTIIAGYYNGYIGVLDAGGSKLREFKAHNDQINSVALSPDGRKVLTSSDDTTAKLWHLDGTLISTLSGHSLRVNRAVFTPNGNKIVTASSDETLRLWKLDGETLKVFDSPGHSLEDVSFTTDGKTMLVSAGGQHFSEIQRWSLDSLEPIKLKTPWLRALASTGNGATMVAGHSDGTIRILAANGDTKFQHQGPDASVTAVSFAPNGETFVASYANGLGQEFNLFGEILSEFKGHKQPIKQIKYTPDGSSVLTSSYDGTVRSWALDRVEKGAVKKFSGTNRWISQIAISDDGKYIVAADEAGKGFVWDKEGALIKTLDDPDFQIGLARFTRDGGLMLASRTGAEIRAYDTSFENPAVLTQELALYRPLAISPDGSRVFLSAVVTGGILWDLENNTTTKYEDVTIASVAFSPKNDALLIGTKEGKARLYDLGGKLQKEYEAHGFVFSSYAHYSVESVAFSPDGQTIAMGSAEDGNIRIASLKGEVIAEYQGHSDTVSRLAFANDGNSLLSVSYDKTARLWDLRGTLLSDFSRQTGEVSALAFSPDNAMLVGSTDGRVQLINFIKVEQFLDRYVQPLSPEQRAKFGLN